MSNNSQEIKVIITKEMFDLTHENFDYDIYYQELENFDWVQYLENYIDLRQAGINTMEKAWEHWTTFGIFENRSYKKIQNDDYNNFDWEQYLKNYPDLKEQGLNDKDKAWYHWFHHGLYEGRTYGNLLVEKLKNK